MNILNWPEYSVGHIDDQSEHDYLIHAEIKETEANHCPHCYGRDFVGFGRRDEVIMDTPIHGKRTGIKLNRRRFRCRSEQCEGEDKTILVLDSVINFMDRG